MRFQFSLKQLLLVIVPIGIGISLAGMTLSGLFDGLTSLGCWFLSGLFLGGTAGGVVMGGSSGTIVDVIVDRAIGIAIGAFFGLLVAAGTFFGILIHFFRSR